MWYPVLLIILMIVFLVLNQPVVKGFLGEAAVRVALLFLNKSEYKVYNNIYFPAYNGLYMQVDHLVVSNGCVVVIETKNYNGQIEGDWRSRNWTISKRGHSHRAYNPMKQNYYHVRMLRENSIVPENFRIYPIVCLGVFAKPETTGNMPVVTPQKLVGCIRKISGGTDRVTASNEILMKISSMMETGRGIGREHVRMQKNLAIRKKRGLCPRCGGKLFYRNSLRGRIAICSNFPWCSYRNKANI